MTPEQAKAKELVEKFMKYADKGAALTKSVMFGTGMKVTPKSKIENAKQCAIICIDEILSSFNSFMDSRRNFRHELEIDAEHFWLSVKEEILKL